MSRTPLLLLALFAAALGAASRPNIVFILADDLGYGEVGYNGQKIIRTPNVDRLAREGMIMTRHYSGNAVCAPSRTVLMTGRNPGHATARDNGDVGDREQFPLPAGIATLLSEGLGDTVRVSLTEAPEKEIPVCYAILQALGLRKTMVEYVACPSCGRTLFNLEDVLHKVRSATAHLTGLDIAVMGCIVNGPGEMADADYGYVGKTPGVISLYRGRDEIRRVPEQEGVEALIALIREDGRWVDP